MSLRRAVLATTTLVAALSLVAASGPVHRYTIDPAGSSVSAKVAFFGLASKTARFPEVSGGVSLEPDRLDTIDLDVTLDASKLTAGDRVTQSRLKGKDFFDVARYPTVRFVGKRMTMRGDRNADVVGEITARGVTRPAILAVTFDSPPAQATGRVAVGLTGRTTINRRDFGMTAYSLIVGREVTITIRARMVPS